jgi:hypothetical protein
MNTLECSSRPSGGIAALLSLIIPGAGQMYKGQVFNGFVCIIGASQVPKTAAEIKRKKEDYEAALREGKLWARARKNAPKFAVVYILLVGIVGAVGYYRHVQNDKNQETHETN